MTKQIRWLTAALAIMTAAGALLGAGSSATARLQDEAEAEAEATPALTLPSACAVPNGDADTGDGTDIESPFGSSPAATPVAADNAADPAAAAALDQLVRAVAACLTNGEHEAVADLVTERFLGQLYGGGAPLSREDYLFLATDLPTVPFQIRSIDRVEMTPDSVGASADVLYVVGSELVHARWDFVPAVDDEGGSGRWLVDAETPLAVEPPDGASTVGIRLDDYAYRLETRETEGPAVILHGSNVGDEEHEILVLRLGPGLSTEDLLLQPGPALPEGVTFVGQATIPAGEEADLVLVDLAPGPYTIVCLLPDAEGTPHLALGMRTRLTIR